MTDNYIQLKKSDVLHLNIKTSDGKETGEYLEFDLEDIELPFIYQEMLEKLKKNRQYLKNQFTIIDKKQDVKGKKLLSKNEEDKLKALNEFFKNQVEAFNMFLGENGVEKLLNGRKIGWTSLAEVEEIVVKQISPYLDLSMNNVTKKIKEKYNIDSKNGEVLK